MAHFKEILENQQNKIQNEEQATTTTTQILIGLPSFVKTAFVTAVQHFNKRISRILKSTLGTFLDLANDSDVALQLEVSDVDEYDWDQNSGPYKLFHNVKIPPHSNVKKRLEINAKSITAMSTMRFKQDGGNDVVFHFRIDQWGAKAPKEKSEEVYLQNGWKAKITVGMDGGKTLQYRYSKIYF